MAFSDSLKRERERKSMTQAQLAEAVGSSQAAISMIESGRILPTVILGVSIAKVLGTTVEKMVEG